MLLSALQVITEHFYQTGQSAVASALVEEAGISEGEEMEEKYREMHAILHEVRFPLFNPLGAHGECAAFGLDRFPGVPMLCIKEGPCSPSDNPHDPSHTDPCSRVYLEGLLWFFWCCSLSLCCISLNATVLRRVASIVTLLPTSYSSKCPFYH